MIFHELLTRETPQTAAGVASLRVNHLIVCASDVAASTAFYTRVFGFKDLGKNEHNDGARTLVHYSPDHDETFEIVVHPYHAWLTPNPAQFSLEVDHDTFERIVACSGERQAREGEYHKLHVVDPAGTRVDILSALEP